MSRYNNGAAPVMIRVLPDGVHRSGRRSVLQPLRTRVVDASAFRPRPSAFRSRSASAGRAARAWRRENIWIGTSSWKYEGWLDQIYTRDRYLTRGKFSQKRFEAECLAEYAETFPDRVRRFLVLSISVAGILEEAVRDCARRSCKFALKVPEEVHGRGVSEASALRAAGGYGERIVSERRRARGAVSWSRWSRIVRGSAPLIFEFGARADCRREFVRHGSSAFLDALPEYVSLCGRGSQSQSTCQPHYFRCLREHRAAHVFNAWTKMPSLSEQIAMPGAIHGRFHGGARAAAAGPCV